MIARGLHRARIAPVAFADNNPDLWGSTVEGIPIFSPDSAARSFGEKASFVIAVWNPSVRRDVEEIGAALSALGCTRVQPFPALFWKYPAFLPYYLWDLPSKVLPHADDIRRAFRLFEEPQSQAEFLAQLKFRSQADFNCLPPAAQSPQYFPPDIFLLREDEYFIDCGAFDGDTVRSFLEQTRGRFNRIVAFEPDPSNFSELLAGLDIPPTVRERISTVAAAVGARQETVRFEAMGTPASAVSEAGGIEVKCTTLDDALRNQSPTMLKLDIEGAELDALEGGVQTIARTTPIMAVCLYHRQEHLWQIPLKLHQLCPTSRLYLRSYCVNGCDLVCYAVPETRLVAGLRSSCAGANIA